MASLLEKTRKINRLLQRSENVEYDGISRVLSNVLNANVYITNKKGKIFGYAFVDDFQTPYTGDIKPKTLCIKTSDVEGEAFLEARVLFEFLNLFLLIIRSAKK